MLTSDASGLASWTTLSTVPSIPSLVASLSGSFWSLSGNTGTTAGTSYIGTADNTDIVFKRNNIEGIRLSGTSSNLVTAKDAQINGVTVGR